MILFIFIGIGLLCTFAGYVLHGGSMVVFIHAWTEFIVIGGAAVGIYGGGNGLAVVKRTIGVVLGLLKPNPFTSKAEYVKLLITLYQMFSVARRDGILGLESHLETPESSAILSQNKTFLHHHHARDFFCDTLKMIVSGSVQPHSIDELMELDLETAHQEAAIVPDAMQTMGDSLPAVGIVACVLGVIITMGRIGGDPADIGAAIGVALVGTFLGVLGAYVVVFPVVRCIILANRAEHQYMNCMRQAIFSFARGDPPIACVEFARRSIDPSVRPGFNETDQAVRAARV